MPIRWESEYGAGDSGDRFRHSQTPYFIGPVVPGIGTELTGGHIIAFSRDGMVMAEWGVIGTRSVSFRVADVDWYHPEPGFFPGLISGVRIRAARTGPVNPALSLFSHLWLYPPGVAQLDAPGSVYVSWPLSSLPLVDPVYNYTANSAPVVPQVEGMFPVPIGFTIDPTFILRVLYVGTTLGVPETSPVANVVLGNHLGHIFAQTGTANALDFNLLPPYVDGSMQTWGDLADRVDLVGSRYRMQKLSLELGFDTAAIVPTEQSTTQGWGSNLYGELGVGDTIDRTIPTPLATRATFEDVATSPVSAWGRTSTGLVYGWGYNSFGHLGFGFATGPSNPIPTLLSLSDVVRIAAGGDTADSGRCFAVTNSGDLYGWGLNAYGALGVGDTLIRMSPVLVNNNISRVASGGGHTVVIRTSGAVQATGRGDSGQLANGSTSGTNTSWQTVTPGAGVAVDVVAGLYTTWLLMADGSVVGAGRSDRGQLGVTASTVTNWTTLPIAGVVRIGTSGDTLYMVLTDNSVWAVGSNERGELGIGSPVPSFSATPQRVLMPENVTFTQIANSLPLESIPAVIALGSDTLVYTWGSATLGQRGNGSVAVEDLSPTYRNGLINVRWVGGGGRIMFADAGEAPPVNPDRPGRTWAQIIG